MIIKYKDVHYEDFALLIKYLSYAEGDGNRLEVGDVESWPGCNPKDGEKLVLVFGESSTFEDGYSPFAKLLSAKPSYNDDDDLIWNVEIEIPDYAHLGVIDNKTGNLKMSTSKSLEYGCLVTSGRMLLEIHNIVRGITRSRIEQESE